MAHYPKAPAPPTPALLRQPKGKLTLKIPGHIWNSVTPEPAQPAPADAPEVQEGADVFKFAIPGAKLADWEKKKVVEGAEKQEKKIRSYHARWEDITKNAREKDRLKREEREKNDGKDAGGSAAQDRPTASRRETTRKLSRP